MLYAAKALLYVVFSVLSGAFVLYSVHPEKRPAVSLHKNVLLVCIILVPLLSMGPLLQTTFLLGEDFGYSEAFKSILTSFEVGHGWLMLTGISFLLFFLNVFNDVREDRFFAVLSLVLMAVMAAAQGYASHAASLNDTGGMAAHTLHLIAVSVWTGVLIVVGWASKNEEHFSAFYKWFTPVALICLAAVIGAGIWLMNYIVPEYYNSWILSYGQALLVKHVLLIAVVFYSIINGIWIARKLNGTTPFHPLKWIKAESLVMMLIFAATAVMGQQVPPHSIEETLKTENPSFFFSYFYEGVITPEMDVSLHVTAAGMAFAILSAAWYVFAYYIIRRDRSYASAALLTVFGSLSLYTAIMLSIN
ncbi:copper resistance D family protein [Fictibacillus iocasae]|uniref:Copper resistance D family protein n=1 Tax=Fictibacillus iocasae TaxID=2715437 RepID=A0ABW2NKA5_9BACL